jgi:hypothetical protein
MTPRDRWRQLFVIAMFLLLSLLAMMLVRAVAGDAAWRPHYQWHFIPCPKEGFFVEAKHGCPKEVRSI